MLSTLKFWKLISVGLFLNEFKTCEKNEKFRGGLFKGLQGQGTESLVGGFGMAIITKCYLYLLYYKLYISFFVILLTFRKQRAIITKSSGTTDNWTVGVDDVEGPPVPMPNTEVKLNGAEDTWMVTSRKNRKMPTYKSSHPIGWLFFCLDIPRQQVY